MNIYIKSHHTLSTIIYSSITQSYRIVDNFVHVVGFRLRCNWWKFHHMIGPFTYIKHATKSFTVTLYLKKVDRDVNEGLVGWLIRSKSTNLDRWTWNPSFLTEIWTSYRRFGMNKNFIFCLPVNLPIFHSRLLLLLGRSVFLPFSKLNICVCFYRRNVF
jgi:hypothetical protein